MGVTVLGLDVRVLDVRDRLSLVKVQRPSGWDGTVGTTVREGGVKCVNYVISVLLMYLLLRGHKYLIKSVRK